MKRFLFFLAVCITSLLVGCSEQETDTKPNTYNETSINLSSEGSEEFLTRSTPPMTRVDEEELIVAIADFLGSIDGALDALDYAVNHGYNYEETRAVVRFNAEMQATIRSLIASVELNSEVRTMFCAPGTTNAQFLNVFSKDVIRLAVSSEVESHEWMNRNVISSKDPSLKDAIIVGQYHNAMMSVLYYPCDFNTLDSYEASLQRFTDPVTQYIQSDDYLNSVIKISEDPLNFDPYNVIEDTDKYKDLKILVKEFISDLYSEVMYYEDYGKIAARFKSKVESSPLSSHEKDALIIGIIVGNFSLSYWLENYMKD